jgi:hypothetical protein
MTSEKTERTLEAVIGEIISVFRNVSDIRSLR